MRSDPDVVVIGAGPNGLTAAALLTQAGLSVLVLEANATIGGAVRTAGVTAPGFKHDLFSGFYPLFPVGPIGQLPLEDYGLHWCAFDRPFAGGTPEGFGVAVSRHPAESVASFERAHQADGAAYKQLMNQWSAGGPAVLDLLFNPLGSPAALRSIGKLHPFARLFEFAQISIAPAYQVAGRYFQGEDARVWYIGSPLHSDMGPDDAGGGLYGLVMMGLAQQVGMPVPEGGAQEIPNALGRYIVRHGGEIRTGERVERIIVRQGRAEAVLSNRVEVHARRAILATVPPTKIFGEMVSLEHVPPSFAEALKRFRWGSGVFKLDVALRELPEFIAPELNGAGVLHLGRSTACLRDSIHQVKQDLLPDAPPLIAGFHTLADPSRAPAGCHTLWIETHVPSGPSGDSANRLTDLDWSALREPFAERLIDELGRYAPDVRSSILDYAALSPVDLEAANASLVGGDIAGGSFSIDQQLIFRPVPGWFRHTMPVRGLYIGGASAHPGGGVHGAAGANAARVLLQDLKITSVQGSVRANVSRVQNWLRTMGPKLT